MQSCPAGRLDLRHLALPTFLPGSCLHLPLRAHLCGVYLLGERLAELGSSAQRQRVAGLDRSRYVERHFRFLDASLQRNRQHAPRPGPHRLIEMLSYVILALVLLVNHKAFAQE